jgi:hypothetical protein
VAGEVERIAKVRLRGRILVHRGQSACVKRHNEWQNMTSLDVLTCKVRVGGEARRASHGRLVNVGLATYYYIAFHRVGTTG